MVKKNNEKKGEKKQCRDEFGTLKSGLVMKIPFRICMASAKYIKDITLHWID